MTRSAGGAGRINSYHSAKSQLVGHAAARQPPAWKATNQGGAGPSSKETGSKILLSNLPPDVSEDEIVDLMKKTIGPVNITQSFMAHNNKGFPRGVTIISFMRPGDAMKARERYDGKVIDGKRAIKLELIVSHVEPPPPRQPPTGPKTNLQDRIGPQLYPATIPSQATPPTRPRSMKPSGLNGFVQQQHKPQTRAPGSLPLITSAPKKVRQKKGAKRVKKSLADLDREMEDYIAAKPDDGFGLQSA
ncbi:hypothetical protein SCHPADRAFT_908142 [Schizopora paradoxa]|uniref:RRM domain-containing protein n=1 Tax=Schizopora paradoxa TaxID=27342 RepID=A0A0H2RW45_9AGAM|nr:hypothetical protein SCHPADRAFT_908142 [Schizopora paradoxa]